MTLLLSTIDLSGHSTYYSERFRIMIEDHLSIIRAMSTNTVYQFARSEMADLYRFTGDFQGLLTHLGYERKYHWVIMRLNGFSSRFEASDKITHLILPDWTYIDKLAALCKEKRA